MKTEIIYEDEAVIVCKKRAGLPVQSAKISETDMESELKSYLKRKGGGDYVGVVHRLDQPVQGIIVFAKNGKAAASLSKQFASTEILHKKYEARVYGHMPDKEGCIKDYLIRDSKNSMARISAEGEKGAKRAELMYRVTGSDEISDMLEINLLTGRYHQIRVQLAAKGHPILGDRKYGSDRSIEATQKEGIRNIQLTAKLLEFVHPSSGKRMTFEYTDGE